MRAALAFPVIFFVLGATAAVADPHVLHVDAGDNAAASSAPPQKFETYRGYSFDLSQDAERKDSAAILDNLKRQLDMVENAGLSPRVLKFFHSIPIVASETDCLGLGAAWACYGLAVPDRERHGTFNVTVWDSQKRQWSNPDPVELAADSGIGVIMVRPYMMTYAQDPVLLHEFLHAYHARLLPMGFDNIGIKGFYAHAKAKNLLPKKAYALFNHKEFFAVTASIFLAGKDAAHEPFTRAALKEKLPDYYKYLVGMFGFDPENPNGTPVALSEADMPSADGASAP
ncbi:hypothetical protein [Bradyrhizobium sp. ARR65]|uniref:hypothetical protein n=1 Tax=Bradyrhizobium sp. ARR65 TaxID=1040989 RepID=UPI000464D66C|nr:hypothetical protein [Bradyrhizobium sp. ARR65]